MANRIIILTGGIGCGKSIVANAFGDLGVGVVDADEISHRLTSSHGKAMPNLIATLGSACANPDGSLNRPWVRQQVFQHPELRSQLESVLHPMIQREAAQELAAAPGLYALYVVPLWVEKYGQRPRRPASYATTATTPLIQASATVVVDCPETLQIQRVMARSGLSEEEVRSIMAAQASRSERLAAADYVIANDQSIESAVSQVKLLHQKLIAS